MGLSKAQKIILLTVPSIYLKLNIILRMKRLIFFNFPNTGCLKGSIVPCVSSELLAQVLIGKVTQYQPRLSI